MIDKNAIHPMKQREKNHPFKIYILTASLIKIHRDKKRYVTSPPLAVQYKPTLNQSDLRKFSNHFQILRFK